MVTDSEIKISMDGKGGALDNVFIERFWHSVKHEYIYLNVYENGLSLWKGFGRQLGLSGSLNWVIPTN